jgi:hypothetical protein
MSEQTEAKPWDKMSTTEMVMTKGWDEMSDEERVIYQRRSDWEHLMWKYGQVSMLVEQAVERFEVNENEAINKLFDYIDDQAEQAAYEKRNELAHDDSVIDEVAMTEGWTEKDEDEEE